MVNTRRIVQAVAWTLLGYVWIGGGVPGWAQGTGAALPPLAMAAAAPTETKVFPLAEIHRGLRGVAYTVFEGVVPEPMEVEILGLLKNSIGPGQDLILARLHGTKPEYTGVVAGMSGSPVYIDGKLVGALSYRIGQFSKEAIAGITPIEQMLEVRDGAIPVGGGVGQKQILRSAQDDNFRGKVSGGGDMQAIETPLVFGGFSQETVERFGDRFRAMGLTPVAGLGGEDKDAVQPEPLVPGSAVSAVLAHDHDEAFAVADRIAVMDAGRLLQVAEPAELWQRPMTREVAEFLGYEAFVAVASPAAAALRRAVIEPVTSVTWDDTSAADSSVARPDAGMLALAPGALLVTGDGVAPAPAPLGRDEDVRLRGTVVGVGFQRGRVELTVEVAGVGRVTVHPPASTRLVVGSVVELVADPAAVAHVQQQR